MPAFRVLFGPKSTGLAASDCHQRVCELSKTCNVCCRSRNGRQPEGICKRVGRRNARESRMPTSVQAGGPRSVVGRERTTYVTSRRSSLVRRTRLTTWSVQASRTFQAINRPAARTRSRMKRLDAFSAPLLYRLLRWRTRWRSRRCAKLSGHLLLPRRILLTALAPLPGSGHLFTRQKTVR